MWLDQWGNWRTDCGVGRSGYAIRMAMLSPADMTFTAYIDPSRRVPQYPSMGFGFAGDECSGIERVYRSVGFVEPTR